MNESLDLRNRINKMRSINNLETNEDEFLKHIKIDSKKTDQKETKKNVKHSKVRITENGRIKKFDNINSEFIPPKEEIINPKYLLKYLLLFL